MMLKETVEWCKPTLVTKYSAGVDLYAKEDVVIGAGETKIVNLGVKIDFKSFWEVYIEIIILVTQKFKQKDLKTLFKE